MTVYTKNVLKDIISGKSITASNLAPAYSATSLLSASLIDGITCTTNTTGVSGFWGQVKNTPWPDFTLLAPITDIVLLKSNAVKFEFFLSISTVQGPVVDRMPGTLAYERSGIQLSRTHFSIHLPYTLQTFEQPIRGIIIGVVGAGRDVLGWQLGFVITSPSGTALEIGQLWAGRRLELGRFTRSSFAWNAGLRGKGERTRHGVAYGESLPSLRSFTVSFENLTDAQRQAFVAYADDVQYVTPHLVEPYEFAPQMPPLYATLQSLSEFKKRTNGPFMWDVSLEYLEAR